MVVDFYSPMHSALGFLEGDVENDVVLQVFSDLKAAEVQWRAFEQTADCTVFQLYDWLTEWYCHVGTTQYLIPIIVVGASLSEIVFILPLAIERRGLIRRLVWLGSELNDYNAPLLAANFNHYVKSEDFISLWQQIVSLIQTNPELKFDVVEFDKMPETVGTQINPFLNLPVVFANFSAHIATLGNDWGQFYASKKTKSTRQTDDRKMRNLAKCGEVKFVQVEDRDEIARTIDILIEQKRSSYARMRVPDVFDRPGYVAFYRALATNLRLRHVIHATRLDVGEIPAATGVGLRFGSCYYLVMSSYQDAMARYSPGRLHIREMMQYAIGEKMQKFDFTIGDEGYKLDWSDITLRLSSYFESHTFRGRVIVAMRTIYHQADVWYNYRMPLLTPRMRKIIGNTRRWLRSMLFF